MAAFLNKNGQKVPLSYLQDLPLLIRAQILAAASHRCCSKKTDNAAPFSQLFLCVCVPSLSWQTDGIFSMKWHRQKSGRFLACRLALQQLLPF